MNFRTGKTLLSSLLTEQTEEGRDRKVLDQRNARWLKARTQSVRGALSLAVGVQALAVLMALPQAFLLALLIVLILDGNRWQSLIEPSIWLLLVLAVRLALASIGEFLSAKAGQTAAHTLRLDLLTSLKQAGPSTLGQMPAGQITSVVLELSETLAGFVGRFLPVQMLAVSLPLLLLAIIAFVDPTSGLILLGAAVLTPVLMGLAGWRTGAAARRQMTAMTRAGGYFLDRLQGLATLKLFGEAEREAERIDAVAKDLRERTMVVLRIAFLSSTALELVAMGALALTAAHIVSAIESELSLWEGLFMLILLPEVFLPLRRLGQHYHDRAAAQGAADQLIDILEYGPKEQAVRSELCVAAPPSISFDSVSLDRADGRRASLDQVSFQIDAGACVALVGESGAGKTSILSLLRGIERASGGEIEISGQKLGSQDLSPSIAWAGQKPHLFADTLRNNLTIGKPTASEKEIADAIQLAELDPVVSNLPQGLETHIGEGGHGLSGGEARRVALARALVRKAPLVLMDEPTANLDAGTASLVRAAIQALKGTATLLIATHDPDLMELADQRITLAAGKIVSDKCESEESGDA